jgi:TatD DNase family protein
MPVLTDAHCHIFDLLDYMPQAEAEAEAEAERRSLGAACAASSWSLRQFEYHEGLAREAKRDGAPPVIPCFGIHPQLPLHFAGKRAREEKGGIEECVEVLRRLAEAGRLSAIGEMGFDLFNDDFKTSEHIQDELFALHLEIALKKGLPLVLHLRRAMHKIFPFAKELKKLPALVFHSWPGSYAEGEALLKRGVNAYFSFGAVIINNHREARKSCALFPAGRLLFETDAPYQPCRGSRFSSWKDLPLICEKAAELRRSAGSPVSFPEELGETAAANFFKVFGNVL